MRFVVRVFFLVAFISSIFLLDHPLLSAQEGKEQVNTNGSTPYTTITSAGPLSNLFFGNDVSTQIQYVGDSSYQVFPPSTIPGDYGTFITYDNNLYAPDFGSHGGSATGSLGAYTPFLPVSQSDISGAGTPDDPYVVTTVVNAGPSIRLTQTDTYVVGEQFFRTDVQLANIGSAGVTGIIYRAMDCYLGNSDNGYGAVDAITGAVACTKNANNTPAGRIEQFFPLTTGSNYFQSSYSTVWREIGLKQPFDNTCRCTNNIDNGMGLSWNFSLGAGTSSSYSHLTVFALTGNLALNVTKIAAAPISLPGEINSYTITINNTNPTSITVASIVDTLPTGFVYRSGTSSGATTANPTINTQTLTWNGPFTINANSALTLTFDVNVSNAIGIYYNNATASATDTPVIASGNTAPIQVAMGMAVTLDGFQAKSVTPFIWAPILGLLLLSTTVVVFYRRKRA